jgi:putative PIN family toxin of toxin-antitoxin system
MMRVVLDTNILVSGAIKPNGMAGRILAYLRHDAFSLLYSREILDELVDVLTRPHLREKYHLTEHYLHFFLHLIRLRGEIVTPNREIRICRDPNDDKFLEVAISGTADYLISRDDDLLTLSVFEGIPIIRPEDFLERLEHETTNK